MVKSDINATICRVCQVEGDYYADLNIHNIRCTSCNSIESAFYAHKQCQNKLKSCICRSCTIKFLDINPFLLDDLDNIVIMYNYRENKIHSVLNLYD